MGNPSLHFVVVRRRIHALLSGLERPEMCPLLCEQCVFISSSTLVALSYTKRRYFSQPHVIAIKLLPIAGVYT